MRYINNSNTMQVTNSIALSMAKSGAMICISGYCIGQMITLENEDRVLVGRNSNMCSYIVNDKQVSRKHMEVVYLASMDKYLLTDYSTNGTYVRSGLSQGEPFERIQTNKNYYLSSRAEIRLGNSDIIFKLR